MKIYGIVATLTIQLYAFSIFFATITPVVFVALKLAPTDIGDSPSGKALVSGTSIRGFESLIPSHA